MNTEFIMNTDYDDYSFMMNWMIIEDSLITSRVFIDSHSLYPLFLKNPDCKHVYVRKFEYISQKLYI